MKRFWRNVVLITLAHIALIAGLIRWSAAAKASSDPESIVWLGGLGEVPADESEKEDSPSSKHPAEDTEAPKAEQDQPTDEKPILATATSEIELPSATPKPAATATPAKPSVTPSPKPKVTPKATPKPTLKKTATAKASPARSATALQARPKATAKPKPSAAKAKTKSNREKITLAKKDSAPQSGTGPGGSASKSGSASGGNNASEFVWYGNMLHDRFYRAWIQPTANVAAGTKISTLVKVRIEKDGRVSKFEIIQPSGNVMVNESVRVVAKQVTHVDAPPTGLIKGDHYEVKINFELNTEQRTPN